MLLLNRRAPTTVQCDFAPIGGNGFVIKLCVFVYTMGAQLVCRVEGYKATYKCGSGTKVVGHDGSIGCGPVLTSNR